MTEVPEKVRDAYGKLPAGWDIERLKFYVDVQSSNVDKVITEGDIPIRLCNYTDVYYNDRITSEMDFQSGSATQKEVDLFQLKHGQVIITKDSETWEDIGVPAFVTEDMPEVLCGYHLCLLNPGLNIDGAFLVWLCRADPLNDQFKLASNGVTRFALGQYPTKNAFIAIPSLDAQRKISKFLDNKTQQINQLIDKKLEFLDRLAEKRQALITQAVTNRSWEKWKLSHAYGNIGSGTTPTASDDRYYTESDGVLWITTGELRERHISKTARRITDEALRRFSALRLYSPGSLLIAMYGATIGRLGIIDIEAACNQACCVFESSDQFDNRFLFYWLWHRRNDLIALSVGGGQPNLSQQDLREEKVPCPPLIVQQQIVKFLDDELAKIDVLARKINEAISLLEEYRSALITSSVTGQIPKLLEDEAV